MTTFEARFWGTCVACHERIVPGESVTYSEDDELVHAACSPQPDPDEPRRNERKCPECFTIHAGECM
jgi:hypothetical protein